MRDIKASVIEKKVEETCLKANFELSSEVLDRLEFFLEKEYSETAKKILKIIIENSKIAEKDRLPLCQDTGTAVFFITIGQEVRITNGDLNSAINNGVKKAYQKGYLRKSIVKDPLYDRTNTNDNTPAIVHFDYVGGDIFKVVFTAKGGGAENMSTIKMLHPTDSEDDIIDFVTDHVKNIGGKPCPPVIVGLGIGGTFELSAILAKKALLLPFDYRHENPSWNNLEDKILNAVNSTGIGPQGLGGLTTALAVKTLYHPCHIASLPVAVNIQCHSHRHACFQL